MTIFSLVAPNLLMVLGSLFCLSQTSIFLPTMPGIISALPMHTALTYGAPMAITLKTWPSVESPPAIAISGTNAPVAAWVRRYRPITRSTTASSGAVARAMAVSHTP